MKKIDVEKMKILSEGERFDGSVLAYDEKERNIFYLCENGEAVAHTESDLITRNKKLFPFTVYFNEIHADILEQYLVKNDRPVPDYLPQRNREGWGFDQQRRKNTN
jgi:hypothetical protein